MPTENRAKVVALIRVNSGSEGERESERCSKCSQNSCCTFGIHLRPPINVDNNFLPVPEIKG